MEPLATPADLREFLQDPGVTDDVAALPLRLASAEVRAFCGQTFDPVTDEELILDGSGSAVLLLPQLPVLDVSLVAEGPGGDRTELAGPDQTSPAWEWSEDGVLRRIDGGVWRRRFRWYRVVQSHGWEPIPDEVLAVVLRIAGRAVDDPAGTLRSETLGRYSYTAAGAEAGVGLFGPDQRMLAGFVVGSGPRPVAVAGGSGS